MRIYPALHYTMGGLWVDYELMSNVPGLFVVGEANFSDHGANRLGASAPDAGAGRRLLRAAVHADATTSPAPKQDRKPTDHAEFKRAEAEVDEQVKKLLAIKGKKTAVEFHRELGKVMWENVGMARTEQSCEQAIGTDPRAARGVLAERERARAPAPT